MIIRVKISRAENLSYFGCVAGTIVNIDMEEYVAGVVASEIGNAPLEACKAQAIAARTFAMHYVGDDKHITTRAAPIRRFVSPDGMRRNTPTPTMERLRPQAWC